MGIKPQFMTAADVARRVGVSPASIKLAAALGKIEIAATTSNGTRLFTREGVEEFARARAAAKASASAPKERLG